MTACADPAGSRRPEHLDTALSCLAALAFGACSQAATLPGFADTYPMHAASQAEVASRVTAFANGVDHPQWLYVLRTAEPIAVPPTDVWHVASRR